MEYNAALQFSSVVRQGEMPAFQRPMVEWTVPDVQEFLGRCRTKLGNRVEEYQRVVAENDVDGEVLIEMNEDGLQTLGIKSFGHRMFICKMLRHYTSSAIRGDTSDTGSAVGSSDSTVRRNEHQSNGQDLDLPRGDVVEERFHFTPVSLTAPRRQASFAFAGDGYGHARAETDGNFRDQDRVRERGMEETGNLAVSRPVEPRMQKATPRIHESKIQIRNKIGTGSVATVYAGLYESHKVAIKKHTLDQGGLDAKAISDLELEVGKMTAVNHPCIVRCFGMLEPTAGIVLELVEGGAVFEIIHGHKGETYSQYSARLPWSKRLPFLLDTLYGLRAIHGAGIIHGDFKTLNLLVTHEGRVKVADFGLSKVLGTMSIVPGTKTISGTPQYMAPEVMQSKPQGLRVDMYSVGVVMWEMMTGVIPWKGMDYVQIIQRVTHPINETQRPPPGRPAIEDQYRKQAPSGFIQLLEDCWAQDPNTRPTADQCVEQLEEIQRRIMWGNGGHFAQDSGDMLESAANAEGVAEAHINSGMNQKMNPKMSPPFQARGHAAGAQVAGYAGDGGGGAGWVAHQQQPAQGLPLKRHRDKEPSRHNEASRHMPAHRPAVHHNTSHYQPRNLDTSRAPDPSGWSGDPHNQATRGQPNHRASERSNPLNPDATSVAASELQALKGLLKTGDNAQLVKALSSFFEICVNSAENQKAVADVGIIEYVLPILERWDRPDLQTKATFCIAAAASLNLKSRACVIQAGSVAALVRLLSSSLPQQQEAAAQALASVVKRTAYQESDNYEEYKVLSATLLDGQEEMNRLGGIERLVKLIASGPSRVCAAAAAAVANAMCNCSENREAFQEAGGVSVILRMMNEGDLLAQENAITALWNAMIDSTEVIKDVNRLNGEQMIIVQLKSGTPLSKELAASAIWKACANDDSDKARYLPAIDALVKLLRSGDGAQEQAAGALRSVCVNSPVNKLELNRVNGIFSLVDVMRSGSLPAREQAGAALANACANCMENQTAARHSGAMHVLVELLIVSPSHDLVECCVCAIRNLCINSPEHQDELCRCNGMVPLLQLLHLNTKPQLLEYVASAIAKACSLSEGNRRFVQQQYGRESLEWVINGQDVGSDTKRHIRAVLEYMKALP